MPNGGITEPNTLALGLRYLWGIVEEPPPVTLNASGIVCGGGGPSAPTTGQLWPRLG
jgi:hypothetical protein